MRNLILLSIFILLTFAGCTGNTETPENTSNAAPNKSVNVNTNTVVSGDNSSPMNTVRTPTPETLNPAETLTPVVRAYCEAVRKKDDAGLKKVLSAANYKRLETDAKTDGKTSVADFLSGIEDVGSKPCATRNEQISGNTAVAEMTTEAYPNGVRMNFIKENGEWKMTGESPDVPIK